MNKKRKIITIICAVIVIMAALPVTYILFHGTMEKEYISNTENYTTTNPFIITDGTDISAHRMGSGLYPEDTMMAAKSLISDIENGKFSVDVIELDLWLTKDNQLILLHDETLDRTTDSKEIFGIDEAKPCDYTVEELKSLNFGEHFEAEDGSTPYKGLREDNIPDDLRVLTLDDLLNYLTSKGDFKYILEIKDSDERGMEAMEQLVNIVKKYDLCEKTILASFHAEVLNYVDKNYPDLHRNANMSEVVSFYLDFLMNKDVDLCDYPYDVLDLTPRYGIFGGTEEFGRSYGLLNLSSQGFVNRAHKCGLSVYYWTVNDEKTINHLKDINADGIITDYPNLAK